MKNFSKLILILIIGITSFHKGYTSYPNGQIRESLEIYSKALKRNIKYSVYLPPSYSCDSINQFKVMYLLHGIWGDENSWLKRCSINHLIDSLIHNSLMPELIVVFPSAGKTYYINDYKSKNNYEDFFIDDLIPHINKHFKVDSSGRSIICGLSMGGFGAIILPFKHPHLFSTSISFSAAIRTPEIFKSLNTDKYNSFFGDIFGKNLVGDERITEHWKQNSPYFIIDSIFADTIKSINWYMDCGMQDFLFPANLAFHQLLMKYNIPHEYHMRIGRHSWEYWRKSFIYSMLYLKYLEEVSNL